jgi:pantothenate synthetase
MRRILSQRQRAIASVSTRNRYIERKQRRDAQAVARDLAVRGDHMPVRTGSTLDDPGKSESGVTTLEDDRRIRCELREERSQATAERPLMRVVEER